MSLSEVPAFQAVLNDLADEQSQGDQSFKKGHLVNPSKAEMQTVFDKYMLDPTTFTKTQRFLIYGYLSSLPKHSTIRAKYISYIWHISNEDDPELFDRSNLLKFLLMASGGELRTQNLLPAEVDKDLEIIDFENPLFRTDNSGQCHDYLGPFSRHLIPGDQLTLQLGIEFRFFKFGEVNAFDASYEFDCVNEPTIRSDVYDLFYGSDLLDVLTFTDYANFVWSEHWYPKFLLMAYANPANVFPADFKTNCVVQWVAGWKDPIEISRHASPDLLRILRFVPRLLAIVSTKIFANYFEEAMDYSIDLFPVLRNARPETIQSELDATIQNYLTDVEVDSTRALDGRLEEDESKTQLFTVISACLYSKNIDLIIELADIDDELTKLCLLLNPSTPDSVIDKMKVSFEIPADIKLETGFESDGIDEDPSHFPEYVSKIANLCHDYEFASTVLERINICAKGKE